MRGRSVNLRSILTVIVLCLYVILQAGEALHTLFVPHFICAQHGELTHSQHTHASKNTRSESSRSLLSVTDDDDQFPHADEHCKVLAERREAPLSGANLSTPNCFEIVFANKSRDVDLPFSPREPVYRTAPKTSPPSLV